MPKELLLKVKPSKRLLWFYSGLHLSVVYILMFHIHLHDAWRILLFISLAVHLLAVNYRMKHYGLEEMLFVEVSTKESQGYLSYLQLKHGNKQVFELIAAWQFFAQAVLLKCRLIDQKRYYWYLFLPDSLIYKDHLRKLILILRFGKFIRASDAQALDSYAIKNKT